MTGLIRNMGLYRPAASAISLVREPTFFDVASNTDPWDQTVTFDGTENLVIVLISLEDNHTATTVTIDPGGGQETALAEIGTVVTGAGTATHIRAYGVFDFTPISGSLTVRVDYGEAHDGAFGVWQFANATRLPTTGDHDSDNGGQTSGTSLTGSISIDAGEEDGIIVGACNINASEDVTPGGGQTERFEDTTHDSGFTVCFSDERGGLSGTEAPSFSWTTSVRRAGKWVLAA